MIGDRLKYARIQAGWTQDEVSKETNIQRTTLSKIENNKYDPSTEQLRILIDLYEVNANWVLNTGMKKKNKEKNTL